MMFLGVFMTILGAAELLIRHHYKRTAHVVTEEDALELTKNMIVCLGGMHDGVHRQKTYSQAWWRQESNKGKDYECYFSILLLLFSTNDDLIEHEYVRNTFADIVRSLYSVYRVVKVKKYFRMSEVMEIHTKVKSIHQNMADLFQLNVNLAEDTRSFDAFSRVDRNELTKRQLEKKEAAQEEKAKKTAPVPPKKMSTSSAAGDAPTHPKTKRVVEPTSATKWGHETLPGEDTATGKWHCLYLIVKSLLTEFSKARKH
jgi:hypothetical protein